MRMTIAALASLTVLMSAVLCGTSGGAGNGPPPGSMTYWEREYAMDTRGARLRTCTTAGVETTFTTRLPDGTDSPRMFGAVFGRQSPLRGTSISFPCDDVDAPVVGLCTLRARENATTIADLNAVFREAHGGAFAGRLYAIEKIIETRVFDPQVLGDTRSACRDIGGAWVEHPERLDAAEAAQGTREMRQRIGRMRRAR